MEKRSEYRKIRSIQNMMRLAYNRATFRTPEYINGAGKLRETGSFLAARGIDNVLVVTGANMERLGKVKPMLESMDAAGVKHTEFIMDRTDPSELDVEEGYSIYVSHGCTAVLALGSGSRMDCAKAIAAKALYPEKKATELCGVMKVKGEGKIAPIIAIPTTSGTGSETTAAAVITDSSTHHKASISDTCLIPRYAILDPELTVSMPPRTTAMTGMDALTHAVECYLNQTFNTELENDLARQAVKLIYENLLAAYRDGSNMTARENMQLAAFYAGRAFTRGQLGYVHAVGHTVGGLYNVPHGMAMAVILPHVLRQYGSAVYDRLAELADVCGIYGVTREEKSMRFISWIERLNAQMGIPSGFDMIREEDVDKMIDWAYAEAVPSYPVPVIWSRDDLRKLINSISFREGANEMTKVDMIKKYLSCMNAHNARAITDCFVEGGIFDDHAGELLTGKKVYLTKKKDIFKTFFRMFLFRPKATIIKIHADESVDYDIKIGPKLLKCTGIVAGMENGRFTDYKVRVRAD